MKLLSLSEASFNALSSVIRRRYIRFCRYYARWFGLPLMKRLKVEVYEIMKEEAVGWWGRQEV